MVSVGGYRELKQIFGAACQWDHLIGVDAFEVFFAIRHEGIFHIAGVRSFSGGIP